MVAHARIGDLREQTLEPRLEGRAPLRRVDVSGFQLAQPHDVDEGRGRGQTLGERARALRAHEVVGIGPLGQEGEAEGMAFAQMGQHAVDGARGGRFARAVAVETDHGLGREQPQPLHLPLGEGGAERGDHILEARLVERDHIHIAFDHDELARGEGGFARGGEVEQCRALVEQLGLGRVEIFRLRGVVERAGAEGDDAAARIEDRDDQPVAEAIEGAAAVIGLHQEAGLEQLALGEAALEERALQRILGAGGVADAEQLEGVGGEPAALGVAESIAAVSFMERTLEEGGGGFERIEQAEPLLLHALELGVGLGHGQARLARELLHRFRKGKALGLHDEGELVAMLAAGEAMIEALLVVDGEGRRLLLVEGRQPLPFAACPLQGHAAGDHLAHGQPGADLIEERIGELHAWSGRRFAPQAHMA